MPPRDGNGRVSWVKNGPPLHRRARACPSPGNDRNGKRRWLVDDFRVINDRGGLSPARRSRSSPLHRRARACPSPGNDRKGKRRWSVDDFRVINDRGGLSPARRSRSSPLHRRARACPSPGPGPPNDRGGQAPALRYAGAFFRGGQALARR